MSEKIVKSELVVKATAALIEAIQKELEIENPSVERAKAILQEGESSENTKGNDGK